MFYENISYKIKKNIIASLLLFTFLLFSQSIFDSVVADEPFSDEYSQKKRIRVGLIEPRAKLVSCDLSFDDAHGIYLQKDKHYYSFEEPLLKFESGDNYSLKRLKGNCEVSELIFSSISEFNLDDYPGYTPIVVNPMNGQKAGLRLVNLDSAFGAKERKWQNSKIEKLDAVCAYSGEQIKFMVANSLAVIKSNNDEKFMFYNKYYRGGISLFRSYSDPSSFFPINDLDLESYLYGVVPKEMPADWHKEALKAQAVCARTYAVSFLGTFSEFDYDVAPTVVSQVYGGFSAEDKRTNNAIDNTRYEELFYKGQRVQAFFHSSNGGFCAASEDFFSEKLPYFRAKEDPYTLKITKPWYVRVSSDELKTKLLADGQDVGQIIGMKVVKINPSQLVEKIKIYGTTGSTEISGKRLRYYLGGNVVKSLYFKIGDSSENIQEDKTKTAANMVENKCEIRIITSGGIKDKKLKDLKYILEDGTVKNITDNKILSANGEKSLPQIKEENQTGDIQNTDKKGMVITGYGWGHNVGMSQWGAKVMADEGHDYKDILKFYYEGTEIEKN